MEKSVTKFTRTLKLIKMYIIYINILVYYVALIFLYIYIFIYR